MIFQHTIDKVLSGEKTQTRRIVKPEDYADRAANGEIIGVHIWADHSNVPTLLRWRVGNTYAVQPGRGKSGVARIKVLRIRREDVREISKEDAQAEGYSSIARFLDVWTEMHDPDVSRMIGVWFSNRSVGIPVHDALFVMHGFVNPRPADRYDAWVLDFELIKSEE